MAVFVDYSMNRDIYAYELCENKDRQEFSCEGRCQLKKQINISEKKEGKKSGVETLLKFEFSSFVSTLNSVKVPVITKTKQRIKTNVPVVLKGHVFILEQPPTV